MIEPQQDNTTPPGFFVIAMRQFWIIWSLLTLAVPATALNIVPEFIDGKGDDEQWTDVRRAVVYQAIADWQALIANDETIHVRFLLLHETTTHYFAMWYVAGEDTADAYNQSLRPWHPDLEQGIIVNLTMPVWFDPTPQTDDDLTNWDALTAIRHEMGHMLGHRHGVYFDRYGTTSATDPWASRIVDGVFDPEGLAIPMANGSHAARGLMSSDIYPRTRFDVQPTAEMLYVAYGYKRPSTPEHHHVTSNILADDQVGLTVTKHIHPVRWVLVAAVILLAVVGGIAHRRHASHRKSPFRR